MRRGMAFLTCGLLAASLLFSGCGDASGSGENDGKKDTKIESTKDGKKETDGSEAKQFKNEKLNGQWLDKVRLHFSDPEVDDDIYVEGIRGYATYEPSYGEKFCFRYHTSEGTFELVVDPYTETAQINLKVSYGGSRFYTAGDSIELDQIKTYIKDLEEGKAGFTAFEREPLDYTPHILFPDLEILYARFVAFAREPIPGLDTNLEDFGIDLGNEYNDFDLTKTLYREVVIKNEHVFENGRCKDCDMTWTKYMNRSLAANEHAKVDEDADKTDWFSTYGPKSKYLLDGVCYTQYTSSSIYSTSLLFHQTMPNDEGSTKDCTISVSQGANGDSVSLRYRYLENFFSVGDGVVNGRYQYHLFVHLQPGETDEILSSKEAFKKKCQCDFYIIEGQEESYKNVWDENSDEAMTEEEIRKIVEAEGYQYRTQDDLIDLFWSEHDTYLNALDAGLSVFDTNLQDIGITFH